MRNDEARVAAGSIGIAGGKDTTTQRSTLVPDHTARLAVAEAGSREGALVEALQGAGVPRRYLDRSFASYTARDGTRAGLEAAKRAAEEPSGLLLIGAPGVGKTHLAVAIIRRRVELWLEKWPAETGIGPTVYYTETGERVEHYDEPIAWTRPSFRSRFVVVPDLLDVLRQRITTPGPDPLEPLLGCPLLVLDDFGREKVSEWVLDRVYRLVNARYNERLATIATTNFSLDELAKRGYQPIVSRLVEDVVAVRLAGPDHRTGRS
ncbi:MAG: ATP-binding protein [Chloroflexi bacterium]|nr:ATP-binding protein [Chloroflexota bacterium]